MKKILMSLLASALIFCSSFGQNLTNQQVQDDINNGIISFVASVKPIIDNSSTFNDFKISLIGANNNQTITTQGNDLLQLAFNLVKNNASAAVMKQQGFQIFANAASFILENSKSDKTLNAGSIALFGGNETELNGFEVSNKEKESKCGESRHCKWYQVGCNLHNVGVWICEHKDLLAGIMYTLGIFYYLTHM